MTNTAKILNFCRGNFAKQERNVADLDDGYARLSNMLLEAYSGADLTKRQFKVLLAILRKTYGWNKPMDRITDSQLSEITKLPVKRCNEAKLELVRMNILAFRENGITTMEQVNAGMRVARRQNRPFLPSPGQFVAWCREEASVTAG
ncbi:TPA: replication protein P, partial [Escherichia coli]